MGNVRAACLKLFHDIIYKNDLRVEGCPNLSHTLLLSTDLPNKWVSYLSQTMKRVFARKAFSDLSMLFVGVVGGLASRCLSQPRARKGSMDEFGMN